MQIKLPKEFTKRIANRAMNHARNDMHRRGWSDYTQKGVIPHYDDGVYGLKVLKDREYIKFQDRGFDRFTMYSLEGKRVPVNGRIVTAKGVGRPGFVKVPSKDGFGYVNKWRDRKWEHPGLKPKNFLKNSMARARLEEGGYIRSEIMRRLKSQ